MILLHGYTERIARTGYAVAPNCLAPAEVAALEAAIDDAVARGDRADAIRDRGAVYAVRNVLDVVPATRSLPEHPGVRRLVEPILGPDAFCVRGTLFDKSAGANWGIFWHQDLSIAVRRREAVDGFGPWTRKAGVTCVQPPVLVLEGMLAVRIHLDDCGPGHGPLKVLPGSHRYARLSGAETAQWESRQTAAICSVPAGGAVIMRPLLLHSSSKMTAPGHRRVIHLEFASVELPSPLQWYYSRERHSCA